MHNFNPDINSITRYSDIRIIRIFVSAKFHPWVRHWQRSTLSARRMNSTSRCHDEIFRSRDVWMWHGCVIYVMWACQSREPRPLKWPFPLVPVNWRLPLSVITEFTTDKGVHYLLEGAALADAMRFLDEVICPCTWVYYPHDVGISHVNHAH